MNRCIILFVGIVLFLSTFVVTSSVFVPSASAWMPEQHNNMSSAATEYICPWLNEDYYSSIMPDDPFTPFYDESIEFNDPSGNASFILSHWSDEPDDTDPELEDELEDCKVVEPWQSILAIFGGPAVYLLGDCGELEFPLTEYHQYKHVWLYELAMSEWTGITYVDGFGGAPNTCKHYIDLSKEAFENDDGALGYCYLSMAAHLLQDMGIPYHTVFHVDDTKARHTAYEEWAETWSKANDALAHAGYVSRNTFIDVEQGLKDLAHESYQYYYDLDHSLSWPKDDDTRNDITVDRLERSAEQTAGLFRYVLVHDLDIRSRLIDFSPVPIVNVTGSIDITMRNRGHTSVWEPFYVVVLENGTEVARVQTVDFFDPIYPCSSKVLSIPWRPSASGLRNITVILDSEDNISDELFENNNRATTFVDVKIPDLTLGDLDIFFSTIPAKCLSTYAYVMAHNIGNGSVVPDGNIYYADVYFDDEFWFNVRSDNVLPPGGAITFYHPWDPAVSGEHNITVVLDPDNSIVERNETNNIAVKTFDIEDYCYYVMDLNASSDDIKISHNSTFTGGDQLVFNATIYNHGNGTIPADPTKILAKFYIDTRSQYVPDSEADSRLSNNPSCSIGTVYLTEDMPPNGSVKITSNVWNAVGGQMKVRVVLDPSHRISEIDEDNNVVTLNFSVEPNPNPVLEIANNFTETGLGGTTPSFLLKITNNGTETDRIEVSQFEFMPSYWTYELSNPSVTLLPGNHKFLKLRFKTNATDGEGEFPIDIHVESAINNSREDQQRVTVKTTQIHDIDIVVHGSDTIVANPGDDVVFNLTVINNGNGPEWVRITANEYPEFEQCWKNGWECRFTWWSYTGENINPFKSKDVTYTLHIPEDAWGGVNYSQYIMAKADSGKANASVFLDITTNLPDISVDDVSLSQSENITEGDVVIVNATILNTGGYTGSFVVWIDVDPYGESRQFSSALENGESETFTYTWNVKYPGNQTIRVYSDATPYGGITNDKVKESNESNNIATIPVEVESLIDVEAELVADKKVVEAGDIVNFTVSVSNDGPSDALNVTIWDTLPDDFVLLEASDDGNIADHVGDIYKIWENKTVQSHTTKQFWMLTQVGSNASVYNQNSIMVAAQTYKGNTRYAFAKEIVKLNRPKLQIFKNTLTPELQPGENATYKIVLRNIGGAGATNISITDVLPDGFAYIAGSKDVDETASTGCKECNLIETADGFLINSTLEPDNETGQQCVFTYQTTINATYGSYTNNASVSESYDTNDTLVLDYPYDDSTVTVKDTLDIILTKQASSEKAQPGDTVDFVVNVTNQNPGPAPIQVLIRDQLPEGFEPVDASPGAISCGPGCVEWYEYIPPFATQSYYITAYVHSDAAYISENEVNVSKVGGLKIMSSRQDDAVFSDDFEDGDISDWTAAASGAGHIVAAMIYPGPDWDLNIRAPSGSSGYAYAISPSFTMDENRDYNVSLVFGFYTPPLHWIEVFRNQHINAVLDDLSGGHWRFICRYDGSNHFVMNMDPYMAYLVEFEVHPNEEFYDIYVGGFYQETCECDSGGPTFPQFRIGDTENGLSNYGRAFYDDFLITQTAYVDLGTSKTARDVVTVVQPDIEIIKEALQEDVVRPGDAVTYRISVRNNGEGTARNITIRDTIPTEFVFNDSVVTTNCDVTTNQTGNSINFTVSELDGLFECSFSYDVLVPSTTDNGIYQNQAELLYAEDNISTPVNVSGIANTNITVKTAVDLIINITSSDTHVQPGDFVNFTINVTNQGTPLSNITIDNIIPDGFDIIDADGGDINGKTIAWTVPLLTTTEYFVQTKVTSNADTSSISKVIVTSDVNASITAQAKETIVVYKPELVIEKTPQNQVIPVDSTTVFTILINNTGAGDAINIDLVDNMHADFVYVGDPFNVTENISVTRTGNIFELDEIPSNDSCIFSYNVLADGANEGNYITYTNTSYYDHDESAMYDGGSVNTSIYVNTRSDLSPISTIIEPVDPSNGEQVNISVFVDELNDISAYGVFMQLLVDGVVTDETTVDVIDDETVEFVWIAEKGLHSLSIDVDPNNIINETNEFNNVLSFDLEIDTGILSIHITDATSLENLEDVVITTQNNENNISDESGMCVLVLGEGTYDITASRMNQSSGIYDYLSQTISNITIIENETTGQEIALNRAGGITGTLLDNDTLVAISNAAVSVNGINATSDESGVFEASPLALGNQEITINTGGYHEHITNTNIVFNQLSNLGNIYLIPKDVTPPAIQVFEPIPKEYSYTGDITINFTVTDGSQIVVNAYLDGLPVTNGQVIDLDAYLLGEHNLTVDAIDSEGNNATELVNFNITDDVSPTITIISPQNMDYSYTADVLVNVSVTDEKSSIASLDIFIDGVSISNNFYEDLFDYAVGQHEITAYAVDSSGNNDSANLSFNVIDDIEPVINNIKSINNSYSYRKDIFIEFEVTDEKSDVESSYAVVNGINYNSTDIIDLKNYLIDDYTIVMFGTDEYNNTANISFNFSVFDDVDPVVNIYSPLSQNYVKNESNIVDVNYSAYDFKDGALDVVVKLDDGVYVDDTINMSALDLGNHTFFVEAVDDSGNDENRTVVFNVVRMNDPPGFSGSTDDIVLEFNANTTVDLDSYFSDPDLETLAYNITYPYNLFTGHFENTFECGSNPGAYVAAISYNSGRFGQGVQINVTDKLSYHLSDDEFNETQGTVELWVKPYWDYDDASNHTFVTIGPGEGFFDVKQRNFFTIQKDDTGNLKAMIKDKDGTLFSASTAVTWQQGELHHIAMTWGNVNSGLSDAEIRLFVDGEEAVNTTGLMININETSDMLILGTSHGYQEQADSIIDEFLIYGITKSEEEINAAYTFEHPVINVVFDASNATITPDTDFVGDSYLKFIATDEFDLTAESNIFKVTVESERLPDPDLSYLTLTGGVGMHPSLQSQYADWYPFTVTVIDTGGQPIQGITAGDFSFTASLGTNTLSHCDLNSYLEWDSVNAQTDVNGEIQWRVRALTSIGADTLDPTPNGGFITIVATVSSVELNDSDDLPVSSCDIDIDGDVDLSDFSRFAVDFGLNHQRSDYDFDSRVTLSDFSDFAVEFGFRQTC